MERQGDEIHVTETEASGGSTPHIVRYVLAISLLLAILALSAIWMTGAAGTGPESGPERASDNAAPSRTGP